MDDVEVVISGVAGNFPGSQDVDELRENLYNMVDLVSDKDCRWSLNDKLGVPNATGKIKNASKFDAAHFGIHRKQVESLDPMTCLMLERSFEAVYDAGMNPASLKGRNVGVYMGSTFSEADSVFDYVAAGSGFGILGHNRSMLASRISFYFDINGPSLVYLSSWTCGVTALSLAVRDIRDGRCSGALVGTPNLTMFPVMSWHLSELGLLSRDAKCKSFDSAADGCGRSDAVVVLYLQRKCDAKRVYASVIHSDFRFFGDQHSYLRPERASLAALLKDFYRSCGVKPEALSFLEADGAGIKGNDREELSAIEEAILKYRKSPLLLGSVKSNLGHTESSSTLVSIVKMLIAMQHGCIPGNLHYKHPAPGIPALTDGRLKVATENTPWSGGYAAINCIGIDGTFGHVLLKSFDKPKEGGYDGLPRLVVASSRTEESLHRLLEKVISTPYDAEYLRLVQDVHSANIVGHIYRGFAIVEPDKKRDVKVERYPGQKRPLWFVYSGMGSQWAGMGAQLMRFPAFRAAIDKCHEMLEPRGLDLRHIVTTTDPTIFDNIMHCFVGVAAIQIALTDLLKQLGLEPDGMIGHSVGEMGCAYFDGCLTAEEMILASHARGRASLETTLIKGMMAAIGLGYQQVKDILPPGVEVACHNSSGSCTLSGPAEDVKTFVADLKAKGIFARTVNVANIAYHSRHIQPAAPRLLGYLKEIIPVGKPRSSRWISTSNPEEEWDSPLARTCSAEYLTNNLLSPVYFEEGSRHLPANAIIVEIAPHGLLQAILKRSLSQECTHVPLTLRGHADGVEYLLTAIGNLYNLGLHPQVANIFPPVEFPVSRGTPFISPIVGWEHSDDWPMINALETDLISGEMEVDVSLSQEEMRVYSGHVVNSRIVFPPAAFLKLAWETIAFIMKEKFHKLPVVFTDVRFHEVVYIPRTGSLQLYVLVQRGSGNFEVTEGTRVIVSGCVTVPDSVDKEFATSVTSVPSAGSLLTSEEVYRELEHRGHHYQGQLRGLLDARVNDTGSVCRVQWCSNWVTFIDCLMQQRIYQTGEEAQIPLTPKSINRLVIDPSKHTDHDTEFEVTSHLNSCIIRGGGVEITGIDTEPIVSNHPQAKMLIDTLQFVGYGNTRLQSVKDFLNVSIQIAVETFHIHKKSYNSRVTVFEKGEHQSILPHLEKCLQNYPHIELDLKTTCWSGPVTESRSTSFLVVVSPNRVSHGLQFLGRSGGFVLTRVGADESWAFSPDVLPVAEQDFGDGKLLLLRKVPQNEQTPTVVKVDDDGAWMTQLRSSLDAKRRVLLVAESDPPAGVVSVVSQVSKEPGAELVRFVFLLDNSAPPFSLTEKWYHPQLQRGLSVNVYREKCWGSYRLLPLSDDSPHAEQHQTTLQVPNLEGVELNYLGLTNRGYEKKKCELEHVDFSGKSGPQRWVMGIARCVDSKPDPLLTWPVPNSWSLEDAVTVPMAYAMAYYAVTVLGYVRRGEKILIHAGGSCVGQAAIAVATATGFQVYTTVSSQEQQSFLLKRFPQLQEECIFSSEDTVFESNIMLATKGNGVDVVINCWPGDRLQASLRCLKMFGRFIHLDKTDLEKNSIIGLSTFAEGTAFYGVASDNLFNASEETKTRIHHLLTAGIEAGVVQPLDRSVFIYQQQDRAVGMLCDEANTNKVILNVRDAKRATNMEVGPTPKLRFDSRGSCLITGGATEAWLDLSEWLLERGAKNLIICQATQPLTNYIQRRVALLRTYHKANVVLTSHMPLTASDAENLVREANSFGPLTSIFALPLTQPGVSQKQCRDLLRNLDRAARNGSVQHFVCLMCGGAEGVCQERCGAGLHGLAVRWAGDGAGLKPVLGALDRLLGSNIEHMVALKASQRRRDNEDKLLGDESARLECILPLTKRQLLLLGAATKTEARSVELLSLSPGLAHVKEVPPVFLVPGIQGPVQQVLQSFAKRLMYPAIGLHLPTSGSIQEMASSLAKEVKRVYPAGPYNLVGETSGGAVTLELAKCLEAQGERTRVFLLEAAPDIAQSALRQLGDGEHLETNLICRLLDLDTEEFREEMMAKSNWKSRVEHAVAKVTLDTSNHEAETLKAAITATYIRIIALLHYKAKGPNVTGQVTLLRSKKEENDTCGLIKYCKNTVNVERVGSNHEEMLSSFEAGNIICNNVII